MGIEALTRKFKNWLGNNGSSSKRIELGQPLLPRGVHNSSEDDRQGQLPKVLSVAKAGPERGSSSSAAPFSAQPDVPAVDVALVEELVGRTLTIHERTGVIYIDASGVPEADLSICGASPAEAMRAAARNVLISRGVPVKYALLPGAICLDGADLYPDFRSTL